jgi:hypothetical protein
MGTLGCLFPLTIFRVLSTSHAHTAISQYMASCRQSSPVWMPHPCCLSPLGLPSSTPPTDPLQIPVRLGPNGIPLLAVTLPCSTFMPGRTLSTTQYTVLWAQSVSIHSPSK